ncbi:MAG: membrane protein insertion efficiency factor YidD [Candidatus Cardinium sp.]|nr:membrane protein insertion efficiency factor YidD [Candidatus Cardinium sp.]
MQQKLSNYLIPIGIKPIKSLNPILYRGIKQCSCFLITCYQQCVAPFLLPCCRFQPSCSDYAKEAFTNYRLYKAFCLTVRRLLRCHPWCNNGYDPLP